jgi:hypothetical protein
MACNNLQYVEVCEEGREIYGINDKTNVSVLWWKLGKLWGYQ